jgi:hypothetical protein
VSEKLSVVQVTTFGLQGGAAPVAFSLHGIYLGLGLTPRMVSARSSATTLVWSKFTR